VDLPADLAAALQPGEELVVNYGPFAMGLRRDGEGRVWLRGALGEAQGPERQDEELALWALLEALGEERAPRACFYCRWSDVEPSSGWGNLGCFLQAGPAYDRFLAEAKPGQLRWITSRLPLRWVREWESCPAFALRPHGLGYRGRPARP
jgi:hypothetical protein